MSITGVAHHRRQAFGAQFVHLFRQNRGRDQPARVQRQGYISGVALLNALKKPRHGAPASDASFPALSGIRRSPSDLERRMRAPPSGRLRRMGRDRCEAAQRVLDLAVAQNIVEKSGAWYSYAGERIGQGRENVRSFLKDHPEIFARIDGQLRQKMGLTGVKQADIPAVPVNGSAQAAEAVKVPVRRQ